MGKGTHQQILSSRQTKMKIVLIGAGNLATNLGRALTAAGHPIEMVYSRTEESAVCLASRLGCRATSSLDKVAEDAGLYIVALKDSVLTEVLPRLLTPARRQALWVHTAGSVPMDIWREYGASRYGVFYPLQTFSKEREVDFAEVPFFLEASGRMEMDILRQLAGTMSRHIHEADSVQRKALHLAAVFVCNFTNAMYAAGARLLEEQGIGFETMLPLIDETARKVHSLHPAVAQTGPAVRYDQGVMGSHLEALSSHPLYRDVYALVSRMIHETCKEREAL
ncbi:MAG: DUF2520 domain-containing protein [Bacteroidaceae bacterium]|nr:DUF2520 domain-containing protein [Bacteroidaceae bacterium]